MKIFSTIALLPLFLLYPFVLVFQAATYLVARRARRGEVSARRGWGITSRRVGERPRIVFFCRVFSPNDQANAVLLTQLCQRMSQTTSIEVVCNVSARKEPPAELARVSTFRWVSLFHVAPFGIKVWDYLHSTVTLLTAFWRYSADTTFVIWTDPPFLDTLLGLFCRLRGVDYSIWLQDWYPRNLAGVGFVQPGTLYSWMNRLQAKAFADAENLICNSTDAQRMLIAEGFRNTVVLENWAAPSELTPVPGARTKRWHNTAFEKRFILQFAGNIGLGFDLSLVERILRGVSPSEDFLFVFQGAGIQRPALEKLISRSPIATMSAWVPRDQISSAMASCDAHLVILSPQLQGTMFPSKFYSILAAGKPVIALAPKDSMLHELVQRAGCGVSADSQNPADAIRAIEEMAKLHHKQPKRLEKMGASGREYLESRWNDEFAAEAFLSIVLPELSQAKPEQRRRTSRRRKS